MFILNKNTNVIQECVNRDVIKVCEKDTKNYVVAATKEELAAVSSQEPQEEPGNNMDEEEQGKAPEGIQGAQNNDPEGQQNSEQKEPEGTEGQDNWKELPEEEKVAALEAKKVDELRKIAKAEGIQGYANMNKDTLIAMIMNH